MSGDSRASSYPQTWEFESKRRYSYRLRSAVNSIYSEAWQKYRWILWWGDFDRVDALSEDSRRTGYLMSEVTLEG
jgi:hypothetical protein